MTIIVSIFIVYGGFLSGGLGECHPAHSLGERVARTIPGSECG
jgi:hypothetical protein